MVPIWDHTTSLVHVFFMLPHESSPYKPVPARSTPLCDHEIDTGSSMLCQQNHMIRHFIWSLHDLDTSSIRFNDKSCNSLGLYMTHQKMMQRSRTLNHVAPSHTWLSPSLTIIHYPHILNPHTKQTHAYNSQSSYNHNSFRNLWINLGVHILQYNIY